MVFFTVGAVVGALAQDFTTLLVGRTIQGIGGGGIISLTEILITDLVPLRQRGKWFGFQSLSWAVGSVTGPLMGGAFAQEASWRWIFWINLPFCALGFLTLPFCLRLHHRPGRIASKLLRFDWPGAFLLTASTTSFLMPVSWGGVLFPWSSFCTLVPLILGIAGLLAFIFYELLKAECPLIPLRIFANRTAAANYTGTLIHGIVLWCLLYYLPLYYETVKAYSPIIAGVAVFPETFTVAPASIVVGVLVSITGRFRWAIWSGWTLTVLGIGLLYLLGPETSVPAFVFLNLVPGLGMGLLFSSMNLATQAAVPERDVAFAAAMYIFTRSLGQSIGVAVGGVVFQSQFAVQLRTHESVAGNATALAQDASGLVQVIKAMPEDAPERRLIVIAYAEALKVVWVIMAGIAFMALVMSMATEGLTLDRKLETEQGLEEKKRERTLDGT
jgi:MFS family permease